MSQENAHGSGPSPAFGLENAETSRGARAAPAPRQRFLVAFTLFVVLVSLFLPLPLAGIWDPPEREVAELSRRIAVNLLAGQNLVVEGAENDVPTRSELGRGELPFSSIAVGFRAFGLHEWAGRLPLALWALVGLAALHVLVRRLSDVRSACFAVLALVTMPLYFLHARTMLGDIVTMAAVTLSWAALGLSVFDRGRGNTLGGRLLCVGIGILGMACGVLSRGLLIGVAVPALSVGISWFGTRAARLLSRDRFGDAVGALALGLGLVSAAFAYRALFRGSDAAHSFNWILGTNVNPPRVLPTFDHVLLQLGHALFPWSAVLPIALAAMLVTPEPSGQREHEAALRALVISLPSCAFLAYGISSPVVGLMPFAGVSAFAVAIALYLRDLERGGRMSRTAVLVTCAFAILLLGDFKNFPEKAFSAFGVVDARFPDDFRQLSDQLLSAGTLVFCGAWFFLLQENSTTESPRFDAREYRVWPRVLQELWAGNALFAVFVLEAALVGLCVIGFLADHVPAFSQLQGMGSAPRSLASRGALAVPGFLASPLILLSIRDAFRTLFDPELGSWFGDGFLGRALRNGLSRASAAWFVCVGFGLCLSLGYYPMLSARVSPKQVFDAYRKAAGPGEPLGILGANASAASYYAGGSVPSFSAPGRAFEWLTATQSRHWLVIHDTELARMNSLYRAQSEPRRNLPVLAGGSSELWLVSNRLDGASNRNPLAAYLPERAPVPSHVMDANLGDELDVLGWDTLDSAGHAVPAVSPGQPYSFVIYYRVVRPISGNWETFIHIDGFQRRFNGDHPTLGGKYPFSLWRVGDFIANRGDFTLEPNFGAGKYRVYFGLYSGNRRLEVHRGVALENRLEAGFLDVR